MRKILVTGGAGFIGSHLTDGLLKAGLKVIVIDNLSTGQKENINPQAKFYKVDICSTEINQIFKKEKPDIVFHLAALPRVPLSLRDPVNTSKVNILGTINVFKASFDANVKRVVYASSSSVYGNQKQMPLKENMSPHPISPYALQKLVGEMFAQLFTNIYKIPIVSLRYFNVYGPRIDFNSEYTLVIGRFLKQRLEKKPLTIFDDGEQARGFCYIDDVVAATIQAAMSKKIKGGEVVNVGNQKAYSINYLAKLIGGRAKYLPPRLGDIRYSRADPALAKKYLGWQPRFSLEKGLQLTKQWFNLHLNKNVQKLS